MRGSPISDTLASENSLPTVYVPWDLPGVINGRHPLLSPLIDAPSTRAIFVGPSSQIDVSQMKVRIDEFEAFSKELVYVFREHPIVQIGDIHAFVQSRQLLIHLLAPTQPHVRFLHTVPQTIGNAPWILHIEHPTFIFSPVLTHGATADVDLRSLPIFWLVRYLLERPNCRAILSHLHDTVDSLGVIFDSPLIASKTHYVKIGLSFTPAQEDKIRAGQRKSDSRNPTILFTNSWHQNPESFFLRGGIDVLCAFLVASKHVPSLRLILRSALPTELNGGLRELIMSHPGITLINTKISDDELIGLYCEASIFALPAFGLHSLSVLRAMYCGAVCITSDAPGYEELIKNDITGFSVPGRRDRIYSVDPSTGWRRDSYASMTDADPEYATRLAELFIKLAGPGPDRERISRAARLEAQTAYDLAIARAAVLKLLRH